MAFILLMLPMSNAAIAADETVTGIELSYDASDYDSSSSALVMYVEGDKVNVSVLASLSGSTSKKDVTASAVWKTSNSSVVKVDKGVLTGAGKGTATISATYGGYTVSVKATSDYVYDEVTIMQGSAPAEAAIDNVELGQSLTFAAHGSKNGVTADITDKAVWSTSSSSVAAVNKGEITLVGPGTVTITAAYKGKSDTVKLTVVSPYKSIEIEPDQANGLLELLVGDDDTKLTAMASPKTGGTLNVTDKAKWTTGNSKVLTVEDGVVTPVAPGKTTITVSHLGVTDKIDVVVRTPYQSIKLTPEKEYHLQLQDQPIQIQAEVLTNSNVTSTVTSLAEWTSSDVMVATVSNGLVTPKAIGTTKITASYKGISRSIDITVYPSITKLSADLDAIDGFVGVSGDLPKIRATTFDGSVVDVTKLVKWTVEDDEIASVKDLKWTAKELGETTLTAHVQGYKADIKLTVHLKPVKLIPEAKEVSAIIGKNTDLPKVTLVNEKGEESDISGLIKWETKSDNIVIMDTAMKGLEPSNVTLTGTYLNKSVMVKVKIEEEIVKLTAEPSIIELNPGRSKSIKVTGHYKSGKTVSLGSKMNWVVNNTDIAMPSGASSVKAINVGSAKVTGTYQGKTVEIPVVVTPKLKSLELSTKSLEMTAGQTQTVKLTAVYTTGNPADQTDSAVWTTSKASVATVKDGKITAVAKGSATIKASFQGKTVTVRVKVK
jgi:Bacterial Ig-like domain (group 2).